MLTAPDHKAAKKRLRRFFEEPTAERRHVPSFISRLADASDVFVFGGAVRDISLLGGAKFNGDVDIVVRSFDKSSLYSILNSFDAKKNKFGGYRLQIGQWKFDVWEASETWAYKVGAVKEQTHLSLLETTFFNWDAIVFDAHQGVLHHGPHYFTDLADKYLELVLEDNPNMLGAFVRALRTLSLSDEIRTGPKMSRFLKAKLAEIADTEIMSYEIGSFAKSYLSKTLLNDFRENADNWGGQDRYQWRESQQQSLFDQLNGHLRELAVYQSDCQTQSKLSQLAIKRCQNDSYRETH
jgi:hypothetical protein